MHKLKALREFLLLGIIHHIKVIARHRDFLQLVKVMAKTHMRPHLMSSVSVCLLPVTCQLTHFTFSAAFLSRGWTGLRLVSGVKPGVEFEFRGRVFEI